MVSMLVWEGVPTNKRILPAVHLGNQLLAALTVAHLAVLSLVQIGL